MRFDLADLNPGIWFAVDEKQPELGRICLRALNTKKREELLKQFTTKTTKYKHGKLQAVEDVDWQAYHRAMWDYCITDWEYIEDTNGMAIPCSTENKQLLVEESPAFQRVVSAMLDNLNEYEMERTEAAEKNS